MQNNILFQLLLILLIFTMMNAIYTRMCDVEKPLTMDKDTYGTQVNAQNGTQDAEKSRTVQFAETNDVQEYASHEKNIINANKKAVVIKKILPTSDMDDAFLYEDTPELELNESRAGDGQHFSEYPDNCGDERTIAAIHDEFVNRDMTRDMDNGDVDGVYKNGQYDLDGTFGYSEFATY